MENYLRTKTLKIGDRTLVIKELSIAAQLRLEEKEHITNDDLFRESMSAEDFEFYKSNLEKLPRQLYKDIDAAFGEVNEREGEKAPLLPPQENKSFREDAAGDKTPPSVEKTSLVP